MALLKAIRTGWTYARLIRGVKKVRQATDKHSEQRARSWVQALLGEQRGLAAKIGQFIDSGSTSLSINEEGLPPLPLSEILPVLQANYDEDISTIFKHIEEAQQAASIGQVHRAQLTTGETVAIKIQYPSIRTSIQNELSALQLIPNIGPLKKWGIDLHGYRQALATNLQHELDYQQEAHNQQQYITTLPTGLRGPRVYSTFCRPQVLVQEWLPGESLSKAAKHWDQRTRNRVGSTLLQHFFQHVFVHHRIHADPHLGNYGCDLGSSTVYLYDYGSLTDIQPTAAQAMLRLIRSLAYREDDDPIALLMLAGFNGTTLSHIHQQIPALLHEIFLPLFTPHPFAMTDWKPGQHIRNMLGESSWYFRSAGPPEFMLLMRAWNGLLQQLTLLRCTIHWWPLLQDILIEQRQQLDELHLPTAPTVSSCAQLSKHLRVRVCEQTGGIQREKVSLTMPAAAISNLAEIIEPEVLKRLHERKIDLQAISQTIIKNGSQPGTVFEDTHDKKSIRVWLE